jgi:hypothetical protein
MRLALLPAIAALATSLAASAQTVAFERGGDAAGDYFGLAVAVAGDVNLDGIPDVLVGAPQVHPGFPGAGYARVLSGADGTTLLTVTGDSTQDLFARAVAAAGDVDLDGWPDLLIGAPGDDDNGPQCGSVRVVSGRDGSVLLDVDGAAAGDVLGVSVAGLGDVDGDGVSDFAAGASQLPTAGGYVRVVSGAGGATIALHALGGPGDRFGSAIAAAGDVDLDGKLDLIAGAPLDDAGGTNAGSARVISSASGAVLYTFLGTYPGGELGNALDGAGDTDADGWPDFVIAAWKEGGGAPGVTPGSVRVFSGRNGAVLWRFIGGGSDDFMGRAVGAAGDVDGDGFADFAMAARHDNDNEHTGAVWVRSGRDGALVRTLFGDDSEDNLGLGLGASADFNGDGYGDVAVGAPEDDHNQPREGYVRAWLGCPGRIVIYGSGCAGSGGFVPRLRIAGCPAPGDVLRFEIDRALGGSSATLRFGRESAAVAVGGGCFQWIGKLLPSTIAVPLGGSGAGMGEGQATRPVPGNVVSGSVITVQAFVADPSGPGGVVPTNAVELTFP